MYKLNNYMISTPLDINASTLAETVNSIGERLVADGRLKASDLERALLVNNNRVEGLGPLLVRLGLISEGEGPDVRGR